MNLSTKRTPKREFLAQMNAVVLWADLLSLIAAFAPDGRPGRPPFEVETMLRIRFMQHWFTLSDPAMEDALHDMALFRNFAQLGWKQRLTDEGTIQRFRHVLKSHKLAEQTLASVNYILVAKCLLLKAGTVVNATLISALSSTKNKRGERDPLKHQSKKENQWYLGLKAHIGVDDESDLVHTVRGIAANVNDVVEANGLLHGDESVVFADAGCQGAGKRPDAKGKVTWHDATTCPVKRKALVGGNLANQCIEQAECLKARVRAKVEHPFRVIKRHFGRLKVRYRGLAKNTAQFKTLFAPFNLWQARKKLLALYGQLRLKSMVMV